MVEVWAATVALLSTLVPAAEGKATRYDPGLMDSVAARRERWGQLDPDVFHLGYVALGECDHVGSLAWIRWPDCPSGAYQDSRDGQCRGDGRLTGPYMVADCGNAAHRALQEANGFAVDLSWPLALQFDVVDAPCDRVTVYIQVGTRPIWETRVIAQTMPAEIR